MRRSSAWLRSIARIAMKLYLVPRTLKVRMILRSSVNLLIISVFFAIFIPSRMGDLLRRRMESRTTSITQLVAGAIASGIEFDDKQNVSDTLEGLRAVADFSYAVVTRANGTMLASVNPDRMSGPITAQSENPTISSQNGILRIDRQVRSKGGTIGFLSIGFSLANEQGEIRSQTLFIIWLCFFVFVIGAAANIGLGIVMAEPLKTMTDVALRIAKGDLSQPNLNVNRVDEIGDMASAFNRMLQMLRDLAQQAQRVGQGDLTGTLVFEGQLGEALRQMIEGQRTLIRQISAVAMKLGSASTQIYAVLEQQEAATARQADGVEEVSLTMQSLLHSAGNIAESARGVFENAQRTRQTTDGMTGHVQTLNKHTARIAELLELIRDIADRSDLLALNASLEATRAGEAGRAFALVAAEMRRLAERITASVQDVKSLLVDILSAAASTGSATDDGRQLAEGTTESARQITMVTQQQRTATGQVLESMNEISSVLAGSVTSMREIRASSELLRKTAENLNEAVGKFKFEG